MAKRDAEDFIDLFHGCYEQWCIAGSVRREVKEVGDIKHVVIPRMRTETTGLFSVSKTVNVLLERCDELFIAGKISKHVYLKGTDKVSYRWGEKYRGCDFKDFNNEIFTAVSENFGSVLAIRTGPWEFSKHLVSGLLHRGYRNHEGFLWKCKACPVCEGRRCDQCDSTGLVPSERVPVMNEQAFFQLAGVPFCKPEDRR